MTVTTKERNIHLRVESRQARAWEIAASRAGLTLSEWLRRIADAAIATPPA